MQMSRRRFRVDRKRRLGVDRRRRLWMEQRFSAAIKARERPALAAGVMDIGKQVKRYFSG
jgi:hypothetical protein